MKKIEAYLIGLITASLGSWFVDIVSTLAPYTYSDSIHYLGGGLVLLAVGYTMSLFYPSEVEQKR